MPSPAWSLPRLPARFVVALVLALLVVIGDVGAAHAQASCRQLQAALEQYDRSSDFRNYDANIQNARALSGAVQDAESLYVRNGCNDDARAGRTLTPQCQGLARDILSLREQASQAAASVDTGGSMQVEREAILQELARFGCGTGGQAGLQQGRGGVFDQIFGDSSDPYYGDGQVFEDGSWGYGFGGSQTVRTLCVRLTDGYFWPISYATLPEYLGQDAGQCFQSCPGTQVDLYYYNNPGQEPEQAVNMAGMAYSSLPTAFRYRTEIDLEHSCQVGAGATQTAALGAPQSVPGDTQPIGSMAIETAASGPATLVDIPLPRRRPGSAPLPQTTETTAMDELRLVEIGDRTVRVVGPDTPYARREATMP